MSTTNGKDAAMYAHYDLVNYRHDDLMRAAARYRLGAPARQPGAPRRRQLTAAPVRLLAGLRAHSIRRTLSRPPASA